MRDLEFRFNVVIWTVMNFVWFGLILASLELIFGHIEAVAGWTKNEALLLACIQALFSDFLWTFVLQNLLHLSYLVRHGELDFVLLNPTIIYEFYSFVG
jgi:ABC-2 type transport system permease protein